MTDLHKIKRNVKSMLEQGAPEQDIDDYIASEGVTLDQVKAAPLNADSGGMFSDAVQFAQDTAVNAMDMATLGWNKKLASAISALPALAPGGQSYMERYDELYEGQKALVDRAQKSPVAKVVGETIGLAPAALMTAGAAPVAAYGAQIAKDLPIYSRVGLRMANAAAPSTMYAPQAAKGLPRLAQTGVETAKGIMKPAATRSGRIVQAGRMGFAGSGISELAKVEDGIDWDDAENIGMGVTTGAMAGAAFGGFAESLPSLANTLRRMAGKTAAPSLKEKAAGKVAKWAQQDGVTPEQLVDRTRAARAAGADEFTIMDAGSRNLPVMGRAISNKGGHGGEILQNFSQGRQAGQYDRNMRAIETNLGPIEDTNVVRQQIKEKADMATRPLYRKAHSADMEVDEELFGALNRPSASDARKYSNTLVEESGRDAKGVWRIDPDNPDSQRMISVEELHNIREGIDMEIQKQLTFNPSFQSTKMGAQMMQTRQLIDDKLKGASEFMSMADAEHARRMGLEDAMNQGQKFHLQKPRDVARFSERATPDELELYRLGAREKMADDLGKIRDGRNISVNFMANPQQRGVLKTIAPDERSGARFNEFLKAERRQTNSDALLRGNSTTAAQLEANKALDNAPAAERLGEMTRSGVVPWMRNRLADFITSSGRMTDAERQVIAEILTETSEEGLSDFFDFALRNAAAELAKQQGVGPASVLGGLSSGLMASDTWGGQ